MTTPVMQQISGKVEMMVSVTQLKQSFGYLVRFIIPNEYKMNTLPVPILARFTSLF